MDGFVMIEARALQRKLSHRKNADFSPSVIDPHCASFVLLRA
jgi:hypothetical protein